ncbi:MAG: hypothetical protein NTW03_10500 [Verrucomicrobia bacterium]|nr:hypothetical protein [Verrucomicrobiota bacterium]
MSTNPIGAGQWERSTCRRLLRWMFSWKTIRRGLLGLAGLVTLVILFYQVENLRGKYAWEHYAKEWEAKGEKFTLKAFAPPLVPDDKNLALTPLLKPIFDFRRTTNGIQPNDTNGMKRLENVNKGLNQPGSHSTSVSVGILDKGTFADLEAMREFFRGNTNFAQPAASGSAAQDIVNAMSHCDPQINELLAALAERPLCRFPVSYDDEVPFGILLPHLARVKSLVNALQIRIVGKLAAGQTAEAYRELKLSFHLSDSIQNEPFLINHLVRILQSFREGLARHAWNETQLAEIQKSLAAKDMIPEFKSVMRSERACCLDVLEYCRRRGFKANTDAFWYNPDGSNEGPPIMISLMSLMPGGWFEQNKLTVARLHQTCYLAVMNKATRRYEPFNEEEQGKTLEAMKRSPYACFAGFFLPAVGRVASKSARMQTFLDAAQVACALERYRLAAGRLPAGLSELAPQFMAAIPHDIMDGNPLRYKVLSGGGYLLYSVGMNRVDDGGKIFAQTFDESFGKDVLGDGKALWTKADNTADWVWALPGDYRQLLTPREKAARKK